MRSKIADKNPDHVSKGCLKALEELNIDVVDEEIDTGLPKSWTTK